MEFSLVAEVIGSGPSGLGHGVPDTQGARRAGEPGRFIVITTYPDNAEPAVIEACKPTVPIVIGCACFAGDALRAR